MIGNLYRQIILYLLLIFNILLLTVSFLNHKSLYELYELYKLYKLYELYELYELYKLYELIKLFYLNFVFF